MNTKLPEENCTAGDECCYPACNCYPSPPTLVVVEQCKRCHTEVTHTTSGVCDKCKARERGNV